MRTSRAALAAVVLAASFVSACADGDGSITLVFPNEVARSVVRRLRVEAYSPDSGGTGLSDRSCRDFLGQARAGMDPLGTPVRGDYQCPEPCEDGWFTDRALQDVPSGRQIVYVLAYASNEVGEMPILEGCTDRFDSTEESGSFEDVQVVLQFVIPDNARLIKTGGDRQVGRAGTELGLPLSVVVEADTPVGGGQYVIPGVPVAFESQTPGYELVGPTEVPTDVRGSSQVNVALPSMAGSGAITARAAALEGVANATPSVEFSASVTVPVQFARTQVIQQLGGRPVKLVLDRLDATPALDLAALTCEGTEIQCSLAQTIPLPGAASLSVFTDVGTLTQRVLTMRSGLGILPTDLKAANLLQPVDTKELAVLNARRADCQNRMCPEDGPCSCFGLAPGAPCPCEGSEIGLFRIDASGIAPIRRYTLTASNSVAFVAVPDSTQTDFERLVVAGRGRMRNDRPCNRRNTCGAPNVTDPEEQQGCENDPETCGCLPNEFCECSDCPLDSSVGFCQGNDKMLDLLARRVGRDEVFNRGGCQELFATCKTSSISSATRPDSECVCGDSERGGSCSDLDGCGCDVPNFVRLGETDAPVIPLGLAAGPLRIGVAPDLVVPSIEGLGLAQSLGTSFEYQGSPVINAPVNEAIVTQLDDASEQEMGLATIPPDIVWIARAPCTDGFRTTCPTIDANEGDAPRMGCLGAYFTDGQESVFQIKLPQDGGCRRHALTFVPDGLCVGRFNADPHIDVAVASTRASNVLIFSGDGRGGLLDPPERVALPDTGGGPLVCADLDGDALDDIAVFSTGPDGRMTGIALLTTSP